VHAFPTDAMAVAGLKYIVARVAAVALVAVIVVVGVPVVRSTVGTAVLGVMALPALLDNRLILVLAAAGGGAFTRSEIFHCEWGGALKSR